MLARQTGMLANWPDINSKILAPKLVIDSLLLAVALRLLLLFH